MQDAGCRMHKIVSLTMTKRQGQTQKLTGLLFATFSNVALVFVGKGA
jgi:hypothetical protein